MSYYTQSELLKLGFKFIGKDVKVSKKSSIYNHEDIELDNYSRVDDFCILSGKIKIGKNVHIAPYCLLAGGLNGIILEDFSGLAYHVQVFTQSDDYSGYTMTNPTIPSEYKDELKKEIIIKRHSIIGAGSIVMPGVILEEGTSIGAMSLVRKSTRPWGIYLGNPAKRIKNRKNNLLELEKKYLESLNNDYV